MEASDCQLLPQRSPAGSRRPRWPRFDASPYLKHFDPVAWTCYDLVRAFYRRELAIDLPAYEDFDAAQASGSWQRVGGQAFGDVAVFGLRRGFDGHVGVVVERLRMLHVVEDGPTCITRFDGGAWRPTLRGFYRWQG